MTGSNKESPVFPIFESIDSQDIIYTSGLTKRELFAAMVMQGLIVHDDLRNFTDIATWSVKTADALLAELERDAKNDI